MTSKFIKSPLPQIEKINPEQIPPDFADGVASWLVSQSSRFLGKDETLYLLAHADDGVIWGRIENDTLALLRLEMGVASLRSKTLQQCRVFGTRGELFVWREAEARWRGRCLVEETAVSYCTLLEEQVLWGDRVLKSRNGFAQIEERRDVGFRQVVPLTVSPDRLGVNQQRVLLTVCHYLSEDGDGQARLILSRLKKVYLGRVPYEA